MGPQSNAGSKIGPGQFSSFPDLKVYEYIHQSGPVSLTFLKTAKGRSMIHCLGLCAKDETCVAVKVSMGLWVGGGSECRTTLPWEFVCEFMFSMLETPKGDFALCSCLELFFILHSMQRKSDLLWETRRSWKPVVSKKKTKLSSKNQFGFIIGLFMQFRIRSHLGQLC